MNKLSSTNRSVLLKLASSLPKGSIQRKAILAGLEKISAPTPNLPRALQLAEEARELVIKAGDLLTESENLTAGASSNITKTFAYYKVDDKWSVFMGAINSVAYTLKKYG